MRRTTKLNISILTGILVAMVVIFLCNISTAATSKLTEDEKEYLGVYVRCPEFHYETHAESCFRVHETVTKIYQNWNKDSEKELSKYELLEIVDPALNLKPCIVLPGFKVIPITWSATYDTLTLKSVGEHKTASKTYEIVYVDREYYAILWGLNDMYVRILKHEDLVKQGMPDY